MCRHALCRWTFAHFAFWKTKNGKHILKRDSKCQTVNRHLIHDKKENYLSQERSPSLQGASVTVISVGCTLQDVHLGKHKNKTNFMNAYLQQVTYRHTSIRQQITYTQNKNTIYSNKLSTQ